MSRLHRDRARAERARQAYVALTRARRGLHLFVHPKPRRRDRKPSKSTLLRKSLARAFECTSTALEAVAARPPHRGRCRACRRCERDCAGTRDRRTRRRTCSRAARSCRWRDEEEHRIQLGTADGTPRRHGRPRGAGTIRPRRPAASRRTAARCARDSNRGCRRWGSSRRRRAAGAERALAALQATLEDARGRWLFDRGTRRGALRTRAHRCARRGRS